MPGLTGLLKTTGETIAHFNEPAETFDRSAESILSRSTVGKVFAEDIYKARYIPALKREIEIQRQLPHNSTLTHNQIREQARKIIRPSHFGPNDEILTAVIQGARREHGDVHAVHVADTISTILHETDESLTRGKWIPQAGGGRVNVRKENYRERGGVNTPSPYRPVSDIENSIRHKMGFVFTPFIAIPHSTQLFNTALNHTIGQVAKAIGERAEGGAFTMKQIAKSGVLEDEIYYSSMRGNKWFDKYFHHPGFNQLRKWQIEVSAITGKHGLFDAAEEYVASGGQDKASEVMLNFLGVNDPKVLLQRRGTQYFTANHLQDIAQLGLNPQQLSNMGLTPDEVLTSMYRSASESMFIRDGMLTPPAWDTTPLRRMMFMYKHFAWSQGKLIKDAFVRAAKMGPKQLTATTAMFGIALPIAGEFVKGMEHLIRGESTDDYQKQNAFGNKSDSGALANAGGEYIDALAHVGGFGMGYSVLRSARRNAMANQLMGPLFSTGLDLGQDMINGRGKAMAKGVISRAGIAGPAISHRMFDKKKKEDYTEQDWLEARELKTQKREAAKVKRESRSLEQIASDEETKRKKKEFRNKLMGDAGSSFGGDITVPLK